jgi:hypothetical protein
MTSFKYVQPGIASYAASYAARFFKSCLLKTHGFVLTQVLDVSKHTCGYKRSLTRPLAFDGLLVGLMNVSANSPRFVVFHPLCNVSRYEDYLDRQITSTDLYYLEDIELARQLVELGYVNTLINVINMYQ